jgi:hypothetical protein
VLVKLSVAHLRLLLVCGIYPPNSHGQCQFRGVKLLFTVLTSIFAASHRFKNIFGLFVKGRINKVLCISKCTIDPMKLSREIIAVYSEKHMRYTNLQSSDKVHNYKLLKRMMLHID